MNTIYINNTRILVSSIGKIFIKDNQVLAKDLNGELYVLFSASRKDLCEEFMVGLKTSMNLTDVVFPQIDFVEAFPKLLEVEKGKLGFIEPFWNGTEGESSDFNYKSANINVAEAVSGNVVGIEVGKTTCTVSKGAKNDTIEIDVVESKDNIMFDHLSTMLSVGSGYMISLIDNGTKVPYGNITFHTSNKTVATVTERGQIDCLKVGVVMITGTYKGKHYGHILEVIA